MQNNAFRATVEQELAEFAWSQWAQLGISADATRGDRWAQDPEALLTFTLNLGRREPRLFDEVLDWLRVNGHLLMRQRLDNLTRGDARSRRLVRAAMSWASEHSTSFRWPPLQSEAPGDQEPEKLFLGLADLPQGKADPHFLRFGFMRPPSQPSGKSRPPLLRAPINFAFRSRELFGLNSRAEIVRYLITVPAPESSASEIAEASAFAKRNVAEALNSLEAGGLVHSRWRGNERVYRFNQELLAIPKPERPTSYVAWRQLLRALTGIVRWVRDDAETERSDYIRASEARRLVDGIRSDLETAGVSMPTDGPHGAEYWDAFVEVVNGALDTLRPLPTIEGEPELVDEPGTDATVWKWSLENPRGEKTSVLVQVSRTALATSREHLPDDTVRAIDTKGRSAVEAILAKGEAMPRRILISTVGVGQED